MLKRLAALLTLVAAAACSSSQPDVGSAKDGSVVRLLAYNIHHAEGMDSVIDLRRIADFINALDPDLVTLQEVDSVTERTGRVDQAAVLATLTDMSHAFGSFMPYQGGAYGMAVLSRWPISETINWRLTDGEEPRTALGVRVRHPQSGREFLLVGIHFYRTEQERLAQATDLERLLEGETAPVILAGDFNSTPGSAVMNHLASSWTILDKGEDRFTFSSVAPVREIDFVLVRPSTQFRILDHRPLHEPLLSDHRPVWTELLLSPY